MTYINSENPAETMTDKPHVWYPATRVPAVTTIDPPPGYTMLLELESGYLASGEYDHEAETFCVWCERYTEQAMPESAEDVDDNLDWVLEETDAVRCWMWIKR